MTALADIPFEPILLRATNLLFCIYFSPPGPGSGAYHGIEHSWHWRLDYGLCTTHRFAWRRRLLLFLDLSFCNKPRLPDRKVREEGILLDSMSSRLGRV